MFNLDLTARRADYAPLAPEKFGEIRESYRLAGGLIPNSACGYIAKRTV